MAAPAQAEALLPALSAYTRELWRAARPMNSVRWLSLEVSSPQVLEDVKALLSVKQKPKHAGQA